MWVKGNLKDRLSTRNHRDKPAHVDIPSSELEAAPMFIKPHTRSVSEMSTTDDNELTTTHSPGNRTSPTRSEKPHGRSPLASAADLEAPNSAGHPLTGIAVTTEDEDIVLPVTPTPLNGPAVTESPSPPPSSDSSSDIPNPSPRFQHPSQAYSRLASPSYSRPLRGQYSAHSNSDDFSVPFEIRVRNPQPDENSHSSEGRESPGTSGVSYTIVTDGDHASGHRPPSLETSGVQ